MLGPTKMIGLLVFFLCAEILMSMPLQEKADTAAINRKSEEAFIIARKNPDISIILGHQALDSSKNINYKKGEADASIALGMAFLAKYNKSDSACFYNNQALALYEELNDSRGKARACYGLAYVNSFKGNLSESERYCALALNYFEQSGDKRGMINSYHVLSYLAKRQNDLDKARGLIQQAIETAQSVKDTIPMADAMNTLGNIYKDMALFSQAIDSYFDALQLWEQKGDSNGIAIAFGSIGLMYYYQKEWDKALEFSFKKLPISQTAGDMWEVSKTYNTIALIYQQKAKPDSALFYLRKSLSINKAMDYPSGIAEAYHNLASVFLLEHNTDSAYFYIQKAVELAKKIDDPTLVNYNITLGNIQKVMGNYSLALKNTLMAYNQGKGKKMPLVVTESSLLLSEIYNLIGHNDLAYKYLKEHEQLQDSISNDEFRTRITRLEIQYTYDKKQKAAEFAQIKERLISDNKIKQQSQYVKTLILLLFLVALISLLYVRHNKLRSDFTRLDLEQKILRSQMNPHFIFNSLCAVQDLIMGGKPHQANSFLAKVAKLMRNILENSREEFIPLEKEIETIKLYLDLQQLRFETSFDYSISLDDSIDAENVSVPPMFTQPCVENSVEHGLLPRKGKGQLNILYKLYDGLMRVEITDNGIGRQLAGTTEKKIKKSVSSTLTAQRLENFKKTVRKMNIGVETIDLYSEGKASGTKVIMMLPYKKIFE